MYGITAFVQKSVGLSLKDSMKLADIEKAKNEGRTEEIILPLDEVFVEYPKIIVTGRQAQLAYNGNPFTERVCENLIYPEKTEERMIFPTFFLDIKNIEYTMSRDGLSLYTLIKTKAVIQNRKNVFRS